MRANEIRNGIVAPSNSFGSVMSPGAPGCDTAVAENLALITGVLLELTAQIAEHNESGMLAERNKLLAESVALQRESMDFSREQATASAKRIGDYADELLKIGIRQVLEDLKSVDVQDDPRQCILSAVSKLDALTK